MAEKNGGERLRKRVAEKYGGERWQGKMAEKKIAGKMAEKYKKSLIGRKT